MKSQSPALNSELTKKRIAAEIEKALVAPARHRHRGVSGRTTRSLVWRAVINEDEPNPAKLADKLGDMVKKAMKECPPK